MPADTLVRVNPAELIEDEPAGGSKVELAAKAGESLGYKGLIKPANKERARNDLLAILKEHNVTVYRPESVKAYKKSQLELATTSFSRTLRVVEFFIILGVVLGLTGIIAVVACAISGSDTGVAWGSVSIGFLTTLGSAFLHGWVSEDKEAAAEWVKCDIKDFTGEIPVSALHTSLRLKEAVPGIRFTIQELEVRSTNFFDPLLFVHLNSAKLCIAVWDEPRFDAPLL